MQYFIPDHYVVPNEEDVWHWYNNISIELEDLCFSEAQKQHLRNYYCHAGLLTRTRRAYFRHHFVRPFAAALPFLFQGNPTPTIVDLGGGSGTQSILFALLGARVITLDLDQLALEILQQRQKHYQILADRKLDIEPICIDAFQFDFSSVGPIHGVYSLFAFNMMQPSHRLLHQLCPGVAYGGRIVIQDGNTLCWIPRIYPPRRRNALSPLQLEATLASLGFQTVRHRGGVVLPPIVWFMFPFSWISTIDEKLAQTWLLPISHEINAMKRSGPE